MNKAIQKTGLILAFTGIMAFTAVDAMAQYGPGREYRPGPKKGYGYGRHYNKRFRHHRRGGLYFLKKELKLTDSQVFKIMDIQNEFRKKAYKNRENRTKMLENKLEMRKKILNVLNAEQKKKFEALPRHMRFKRCPRGMMR